MICEQLISNEYAVIQRIRPRVQGKDILLVTEQVARPQCTYSVIGHYLYHILKAAGANIIVHDVTVDIRTKRKFEIGIYSHYETTDKLRQNRLQLKELRRICKHLSFYANLVPKLDISCDQYFLSRQCFLDRNDEWYKWWQFEKPAKREFKKAKVIGRGIDPYLLVPAQQEFMICLDSRFRGPIKKAREIKVALEKYSIKVRPIGFTDHTWQVAKLPFEKIAQVYGKSSAFISTIPGIFEMPAIEAQCADNAIISYQDCLPRELCGSDSTFVCDTTEDIIEAVASLQESHDPDVPRDFVKNWTWTNIVEKMSRIWA